MTDKLPRFLLPGELAELVKMPPARILRLARAGKIPHYTMPDETLLFAEHEIQEWLKSLRGEALTHA